MPPLAVSSGPARALLPSIIILSLLSPLPACAWSGAVPADVELRTITADPNGCPLVGGLRRRGGTTTVYAAKYRPDGALLWSTDTATSSPIDGEALEAVADSSGDLYVVGTESLDAERTIPFAARYSGDDGRLLWHSTVAPPSMLGAVTEGTGETLSVGAKGELVVGGSLRTDGGERGIVCRLSPMDGSIQWSWTGENLVVRDTGVDRDGDVLATGTFFLAVKLDGTDGAELWRATTADASAQELGYPQMRSLALDRSGNVTVGGSLRDTLDDTRAFYTGAFNARTGRALWENTGAPLHSFEAPARVLTSGSDVIAGGRQGGSPTVVAFKSRTGKPRWSREPWSVDDFTDRALGVADLATDGKCVFALGTDFPGRVLLHTFTAAGKSRWQRDLGQGQGVQLAIAAKRRLYALVRRAGIDGLDWHFELLGLDTGSGRDL